MIESLKLKILSFLNKYFVDTYKERLLAALFLLLICKLPNCGVDFFSSAPTNF